MNEQPVCKSLNPAAQILSLSLSDDLANTTIRPRDPGDLSSQPDVTPEHNVSVGLEPAKTPIPETDKQKVSRNDPSEHPIYCSLEDLTESHQSFPSLTGGEMPPPNNDGASSLISPSKSDSPQLFSSVETEGTVCESPITKDTPNSPYRTANPRTSPERGSHEDSTNLRWEADDTHQESSTNLTSLPPPPPLDDFDGPEWETLLPHPSVSQNLRDPAPRNTESESAGLECDMELTSVPARCDEHPTDTLGSS